MTAKIKNKVVTYVMMGFLIGGAVLCLCKAPNQFSDSERRALTQFPEVSADAIVSGEFMTAFESYTLDQFPFRDQLRRLKAFSSFYLFRQKDNNDIYIAGDSASKMEYPMKEDSIERAAQRFGHVYHKYLAASDAKVYFSIIPDKNYFLAEKEGYLSMDYETFLDRMIQKTDFMEYIDIAGLLSADDFYKTDTHWKQENLLPVAQKLGRQMDASLLGEYEIKTLDVPFYGVYYGQSALPLPAEELHYLTNEALEEYIVYDFQNQKQMTVYDMEKAYGKDPYEMFLSGALPLLTIENPKTDSQKELILFRDSFGSSIAPLLAEGYKKVTLVDIRYMHPDMLGNYITFTNQDVLFLYSTLVLNNAETIK